MNLARVHTLVFAAIVLLVMVFLSPFAMTLLLAAITSYVLQPLVHALQKRVRSYNLALLATILIIFAPLAAFFRYVAGDITPILADIRAFSGNINALLELARQELSAFGLEKYASGMQNVLSEITAYLLGQTGAFVKSIPRLLLNIAIYLFATYHFIKDGSAMITYVKEFGRTLEREEQLLLGSILRGLKKSFDVLFISYIAMSAITAALAWIGYYIIGVPHSAFLGLLTGLFAFLPILGVWMVYVPAAIYEYSIGNVNSAIFVVIYGAVVLTAFMDLIVRPALGVMKTGVNPLTVFLGFFSGPLVMGPAGIIVGPIVFVVAETVVKEYINFEVQNKKAKK